MNSKLGKLSKQFALKVRVERTKRGFTQEKLAALANLNTNSISAIERCKSSPTLETVYAIAKAFNIKLSKLVDVEKLDF